MKTYILIKDLPDCKAGAEFEPADSDCGYQCNAKHIYYTKNIVENNPDWFKLKQSLFETEDGYDVEFGKTVYCVLEDFEIVTTFIAERLKDVKCFKHLSNAQQYVIDNKPIFSLEDIVDLLKTELGDCKYLVQKITELAKEKCGV